MSCTNKWLLNKRIHEVSLKRSLAEKFIWWRHICCCWLFDQWDTTTATPMKEVSVPLKSACWILNLISSHSMRVSLLSLWTFKPTYIYIYIYIHNIYIHTHTHTHIYIYIYIYIYMNDDQNQWRGWSEKMIGSKVHTMTSHELLINGIQALQHQWKKCVPARKTMLKINLILSHSFRVSWSDCERFSQSSFIKDRDA